MLDGLVLEAARRARGRRRGREGCGAGGEALGPGAPRRRREGGRGCDDEEEATGGDEAEYGDVQAIETGDHTTDDAELDGFERRRVPPTPEQQASRDATALPAPPAPFRQRATPLSATSRAKSPHAANSVTKCTTPHSDT